MHTNKLKIAIIGLGLIGGSMAKAFKKYTDYDIMGYDSDESTLDDAIKQGAVDRRFDFEKCDILISCLYPGATVQFVCENADRIDKDTIITDCGGVKATVCNALYRIAQEHGFTFIGMHPMAGIEKSGFSNSFAELFSGASLIVTPYDDTSKSKVDFLVDAFMKIGFGSAKITTPENHDRVIAYTSQLAHVLSASYIKSPTAMMHKGFSAGSFKDMTRVARLNEAMWTELFLENADNLASETELLIENLNDILTAIKSRDRDRLYGLLKDGREKKERSENL